MSAPNSTGMSDAADAAGAARPAQAPGHRAARLARSTLIFSVATGLSRVLGLVREMVAAYFGVNGKINAFTVAFQIPNLVRALVADAALSGAFVPVFSDLLEKGDRKRAWRVASTIFWLVLLVLGGLTALFILIAPLLIRLFGNPGGDFDLAVGLSRVLFPIVVLLGLSGVIVGILNSYDHFTVPALTPVFWNLAIIAGLVLGVPRVSSENAQLYVYAGAILVGTVIQLLLPCPWLRGLDGRLQLVLDWRDPAVRRFFTLMLPVTLTLGLINVNAVIDTLFASRLIDPMLAPAAINAAFRLYMLPQGMFSVAVATVLFPRSRGSRLAERPRRVSRHGQHRLAPDRLPPDPRRVVSAVLAEPIVRLVYERGAFTEADVTVVAGCARGVLARPRLQRLDADADPRVLRPPVELDPDRDRPRQPRPERGARRGVLPARRVGDPARDVARQHRRSRSARVLPPARLGRPPGSTPSAERQPGVVVASVAVAAVAFPVWYGLDRAIGRSLGGQIVSLGVALLVAGGVYLWCLQGSRGEGARSTLSPASPVRRQRLGESMIKEEAGSQNR